MNRKKVVPIILIFFFVILSIFFPYNKMLELSDEMFVTHEELKELLNSDFLWS